MTNSLIRGDNIVVMQELLQNGFGGKIDCIYIDPPYNNGEDYTFYSDYISHELWIEMMRKTIMLLRKFINPNGGSLWISIDDAEMPYLRVLCDEIMGRSSFVSTIVWQQRNTRENRKAFSNNHEYILVYTLNLKSFKDKRNLLPPTKTMIESYTNPDNDPRGPWQSITCNAQDGHSVPNQFYWIQAPNGKRHYPPQGRCWIHKKDVMEKLISDGRIWFGKDGNGVPRKKKYLSEAQLGVVPESLWLADFAGTNMDAKKHLLDLGIYKKYIFDTPKPEKLIKRILEISTNKEDLVMDVFLGSGTTASTAHKMNRKYIGIENNAITFEHAVKRMECVIGGEPGGISKDVGWAGGGMYDVFIECDGTLKEMNPKRASA